MNERSNLILRSALCLAWIGGCADPCVDDGLSQQDESTCPSLGAGTHGGDSTTTSAEETGAPPTGCENEIRDGDETDVDCGGSCDDACGDGQGCGGDDDCSSGHCDAGGMCGEPPNCDNGIKDGDETDVDCGGSCDGCGLGELCDSGADCETGYCPAGTCEEPPTCTDGQHNGDETDLDCGGPCPPCEDGEMCLVSPDCISAVCEGEICQAPSCDDGVHNGDETDLDCGGSCPPCGNGLMCNDGTDCQTELCIGGICVAPSCTDGLLNGDEVDVDCGGPECGPCGPGQACLENQGCDSQLCDTKVGVCLTPTCTDGVINGDETDLDCGGMCGPTCEPGEACLVGQDCVTFGCDAGTSACNDYLALEAGPSCSTFDGAPATLEAVVSGGSGVYSYAWTPDDGSLSAADQAITEASPDGFQTYVVTVDDGYESLQGSVVVVDAEPFDLENNCTLYSGDGLFGDFPPSITYDLDGTRACETLNNGYGLHLCEGVEFQNVRLQGTLEVSSGGPPDDDMIGLVWGAQDPSNYYMLSWKAAPQDFGVGCVFPTGIVVKRVFAPSIDDLDGADIACDVDTIYSTSLLGPDETTDEPWQYDEPYTVTIDFTDTGSTVSVVRDSDGSLITTFFVGDTTHTSGFFGSTAWSQDGACTGPLFAECL